ncbi:MAG: hypothetical protein ACYDAE_10820 [Steroidobacteraceae bacterium]
MLAFAESLLQRALKAGADGVPGINRLVDAYNAVSLSRLLPIGREVLDRLTGEGVLRLATAADAVDLRPRVGPAKARRADLGRRAWRDAPQMELTPGRTDASHGVQAQRVFHHRGLAQRGHRAGWNRPP